MRYAPTIIPPLMPLPLARHYAKTRGASYRRSRWGADGTEEDVRWFSYGGGLDFVTDADGRRVVENEDLTEDDFAAADWTILPTDCNLGDAGCTCLSLFYWWSYPIYDDSGLPSADLTNPNAHLGVQACEAGHECDCGGGSGETGEGGSGEGGSGSGSGGSLPAAGSQSRVTTISGFGSAGGGGSGGGPPQPDTSGSPGNNPPGNRNRGRKKKTPDSAPALTVTVNEVHDSCEKIADYTEQGNKVMGKWTVTVALAQDDSGDVYSVKTTVLGTVVNITSLAVGTQSDFAFQKLYQPMAQVDMDVSAKLLGKNKESNKTEKITFPPVCLSSSTTGTGSSSDSGTGSGTSTSSTSSSTQGPP